MSKLEIGRKYKILGVSDVPQLDWGGGEIFKTFIVNCDVFIKLTKNNGTVVDFINDDIFPEKVFKMYTWAAEKYFVSVDKIKNLKLI